jgi:hypothetical protein
VKKTWRFRALSGDVARVMATSTSLGAAATALGVDKSTVFRWVKAGKVPAPGARRRRRAAPAADTGGGPQSPAAWATWARQTFVLSGTEAALLDLAVDALTLARDPAQKPEVRLNAAGRFQQLVRQLKFEEATDDGQAASDRGQGFPRRVG